MIQTQHEAPIDWYPVRLFTFIDLSHYVYNEGGTLLHKGSLVSQRATIALYALARWNAYLSTEDYVHRDAFLALAHRCVEQENAPVLFWAAETLGCELSILIRAYGITGNDEFLHAATHIARYFERDLFDGGIVAPVGITGKFFEEAIRYPASHSLRGHLFALLGLSDYVALTHNSPLETVLQCALTTLHTLLYEFDAGFWTYTNILHRTLSSPEQLAQQIQLLRGLADITHDVVYMQTAMRWQRYERSLTCRLRYRVRLSTFVCKNQMLGSLRTMLFPALYLQKTYSPLRVCITVNAFPVLGGIRTVLLSMEEVMRGLWHTEYLTRFIGPNAETFTIHRFGSDAISPWHAHTVWLYVLDGCRSLLRLLRRGAGYHIVFPQDGVYTAAFTGAIAKLAGVRVVCIDHAYLTMLNNPSYQDERLKELSNKPWYIRTAGHILLALYWPSMDLLAWIAARCTDAYFIPGIAGDGVEISCTRLGIPASRITRFASMIELKHHALLEEDTKHMLRQQLDIPGDAIVIALICRLALEKGLNVAVAGIELALTLLEPEMKKRVRIVIAGDGPVREYVERDIEQRQLQHVCSLRGNIAHEEALQLLSISDIFLNTTVRGTCFPMSILEAMASACAVIASTQPISNVELLKDGRGIVVSAGDVLQTGKALAQLIVDEPLRRTMGQSARKYIAIHHSPEQFRRSLQRVTHWTPTESLSV